MNNEEQFKKVLEKIEALKKSNKFDLSLEEDLSLAVMNLISLEEHFFFTAEKTGKLDYLDLLKETREIRKELMARLVNQNEGETWCISKHLLSATMRLIEVGTKLQTENKIEEAKKMFASAYRVYALFWAVRLKIIDLASVKKIPDSALNKEDQNPQNKPWTFEDIVAKLVDCCHE